MRGCQARIMQRGNSAAQPCLMVFARTRVDLRSKPCTCHFLFAITYSQMDDRTPPSPPLVRVEQERLPGEIGRNSRKPRAGGLGERFGAVPGSSESRDACLGQGSGLSSDKSFELAILKTHRPGLLAERNQRKKSRRVCVVVDTRRQLVLPTYASSLVYRCRRLSIDVHQHLSYMILHRSIHVVACIISCGSIFIFHLQKQRK